MSYLINNQQKVNDIIFENRNKTYGAYAIRSAYGNTVFKSLACMLLGFGTIMSLAFYLTNRPADQSGITGQLNDRDSIYTLAINLEPEKHPEPPKQLQQPPSGGGSPGMSTVISNTATETNTTDIAGPPSTNTITSVGPPNPPSTTTVAVTPTVDANEPVVIPDSPPEFEGGLSALYAFLGSKLKYPEEAHEIGKEGTVYVKFVVDQNGKVGSLSLLNTQGYGLDQEALRVVGMIPTFKNPGKVNGKAVKVYYQLPIKFKIR